MIENDRLPSLTAVEPQDDVTPPSGMAAEQRVVARQKTAVTPWVAWLLSFVLLLALLLLGWWSKQQVDLLKQQIVATQESFASISEDASGRFHEVSGAVTAEQEKFRQELAQLQAGQQQLAQQQDKIAARLGATSGRIDELSSTLKGNTERLEQLGQGLNQGLLSLDQRVQELSAALQLQESALQQQQSELERQQQWQEHHGQQYEQTAALIDSMQELLDLHGTQLQSMQDIAGNMLPQLRQLQSRQDEFSHELAAFRAQTTRSINELRSSP